MDLTFKLTFNLPTANDILPSGHPDNTYKDNILLRDSGQQYTMYANGFLAVRKLSSTKGQYIQFSNTSSGIIMTKYREIDAQAETGLELYMSVSKGDNIIFSYTANGSLSYFKFIYAKSQKCIIKYNI